jgi:hypothetical protein
MLEYLQPADGLPEHVARDDAVRCYDVYHGEPAFPEESQATRGGYK